MTRHLIRLMWNRKRQNLLLTLEIFVAFLVVVAVGVLLTHFGHNARQPLGFTIANVWSLEVRRGDGGPREQTESEVLTRDTFQRVMSELRALPGVEAVGSGFAGPYLWYSWNEMVRLRGQPEQMVSYNRADDTFADVLGVRMQQGRWFTTEDDGVDWEPVVINATLARRAFGDGPAVGQMLPEVPSDRSRPGPLTPAVTRRAKRVVGVIGDFRQFGELSTPGPVLFYRLDLDAPVERLEWPENILLRVAPGTTAAFEETVARRLAGVAPDWSFVIRPVDALRESMLRDNLVPLTIVSVVAGALLLMVALGLIGVVWQNVTQRRREFGLRRAQGATARAVGWQVVGELVVVTSFAVLAGLVLIAQVPLLPLPPDLTLPSRGVFLGGVTAALVTVYAVTLLCAWYPAVLATRVPPAAALRDD